MNMATSTFVLIIFGSSLWISMMIVSAITRVFPRALKVTAPLVCRSGEEMTVFVGKASYHRPSEYGLTIQCVGSTGGRTVTLRAFFLAWIVLSIPMLIIGTAFLMVIKVL
jgi:hypothetical protein